MDHHNAAITLARSLSAHEEIGPIRRSTSGASPSPNSKPRPVPARIKLLIADLGLRYRPAAAADLDAHAASLALLAIDLCDLPPDRLERAIREWVRAERWMPKASELVALCQKHQRNETDEHYHPAAEQASAEAYADARNAGLAGSNRPDIEWFVDATGQARLRYKLSEDQLLWKRNRVRPAEVSRLNAGLKRYGSALRWTPDGFPFDLAPGEVDPAPTDYPWGSAIRSNPAQATGRP